MSFHSHRQYHWLAAMQLCLPVIRDDTHNYYLIIYRSVLSLLLKNYWHIRYSCFAIFIYSYTFPDYFFTIPDCFPQNCFISRQKKCLLKCSHFVLKKKSYSLQQCLDIWEKMSINNLFSVVLKKTCWKSLKTGNLH